MSSIPKVNFSTAVEIVRRGFRLTSPVLLVGSPGIGKSAIPSLVSKEDGADLIITTAALPELSEKPRLFRAGMDSSEGEAFLAFMFQCRLPH